MKLAGIFHKSLSSHGLSRLERATWEGEVRTFKTMGLMRGVNHVDSFAWITWASSLCLVIVSLRFIDVDGNDTMSRYEVGLHDCGTLYCNFIQMKS